MENKIAERLTAARKHGKLSQEEAAAKLGISRQTLSKWENGDGLPDSEKLILIAELYDISLDVLLLGREPKLDSVTYEQLMESASEEEDEYAGAVTELLAKPAEESSVLDRFIRYFPFPILCVIVFLALGFAFNSWEVCWTVFLAVPAYYATLRGAKQGKTLNIVYPIACVVLYVALGLVLHFGFGSDEGWKRGWVLLFSVPLVNSVVKAVKKHNFFYFNYPALVLMVYLFMGMWKGGIWWHPMWIVFLTIPLYYGIGKLVNRKTDS